MLLPAISAAIGLLALLLMNLGLTVREAERVPNGFRALLDWCYTNVGEKLQRYVKVVGGIYLASRLARF